MGKPKETPTPPVKIKRSKINGLPLGKPIGRPVGTTLDEPVNFDVLAACDRLIPIGFATCEKILRTKGNAISRQTLQFQITRFMTERRYGLPITPITGAGGGPLVATFTQIVQQIDGAKVEKL